MTAKQRGHSYMKRVADINRIYNEHAKSGLSNREIWRRFIYPVYGVNERTFYNALKAPLKAENAKHCDAPSLFEFDDDSDQ